MTGPWLFHVIFGAFEKPMLTSLLKKDKKGKTTMLVWFEFHLQLK